MGLVYSVIHFTLHHIVAVNIPSCSFSFPVQDLTLGGLVSGVEVSVVDAESLTVKDTLVHKCTFAVVELLGTKFKLKRQHLRL